MHFTSRAGMSLRNKTIIKPLPRNFVPSIPNLFQLYQQDRFGVQKTHSLFSIKVHMRSALLELHYRTLIGHHWSAIQHTTLLDRHSRQMNFDQLNLAQPLLTTCVDGKASSRTVDKKKFSEMNQFKYRFTNVIKGEMCCLFLKFWQVRIPTSSKFLDG